jgi:hypothetical protein
MNPYSIADFTRVGTLLETWVNVSGWKVWEPRHDFDIKAL